ncbi:hypothetical protein EJ04DRAFT_239268 [Polyplosphaeria fusca]|uniref:Uncharacterized protein n=1 Tax=Polyplosphaeria fusca TaxID=682080 RepID=A0A9P4V853_9PLEO|nr:hypothetical protein EJ04DRAFT_239268 [Polyplosphaeria fusca]
MASRWAVDLMSAVVRSACELVLACMRESNRSPQEPYVTVRVCRAHSPWVGLQCCSGGSADWSLELSLAIWRSTVAARRGIFVSAREAVHAPHYCDAPWTEGPLDRMSWRDQCTLCWADSSDDGRLLQVRAGTSKAAAIRPWIAYRSKPCIHFIPLRALAQRCLPHLLYLIARILSPGSPIHISAHPVCANSYLLDASMQFISEGCVTGGSCHVPDLGRARARAPTKTGGEQLTSRRMRAMKHSSLDAYAVSEKLCLSGTLFPAALQSHVSFEDEGVPGAIATTMAMAISEVLSTGTLPPIYRGHGRRGST